MFSNMGSGTVDKIKLIAVCSTDGGRRWASIPSQLVFDEVRTQCAQMHSHTHTRAHIHVHDKHPKQQVTEGNPGNDDQAIRERNTANFGDDYCKLVVDISLTCFPELQSS